ncbi:3'-5' exoribonuclease YhaM [Clostridium aceticum]|uniref:3'-5' exoribonuclease YhaM n=1 Tax=Clostridium aceticum TaxID=84022 RepID=A0A0D8IB92_9CLOT|nr:HD domain-containing protein [Clostridium aceticum]AKL96787.1 3'-5' exoribonuclease YhaM [Clostridium aceticum]KJF27543.1 phosphohydrolase [Clostridium aceticum]
MYIKQLKDLSSKLLNETIEAVVLLSEVKVKTTKTDKKYADIIIQDASRMMEAKYWDYEENQEKFKSFQPHEIVQIQGQVGEYGGQLQLTIRNIERASSDKVSIKDLIPTSPWEFESMKKGLEYFQNRIETPHLKELIDKMIFSAEYYEKFCTYPAARKVHHNFYRGLLHHTLEVLKLVNTVANTKKLSQHQTDRLFVMTMLHDWGKMMEYKALPELGLTEKGMMIGHIFLGAHYTLNAIHEINDFPEEDKLVILNGILGHHGSLEFGSPVLPKTVEAQILHQADKMSGDVESILSFIKEDAEEEENFTKRLWNMGTEYYKK